MKEEVVFFLSFSLFLFVNHTIWTAYKEELALSHLGQKWRFYFPPISILSPT